MTTININQLQPPGILEHALEMRKKDILIYIDKKTGELKNELSEYTNCLICDNNDTELLFIKEGFKYVKCKYCTLIYINPRLNQDKLNELYTTGRFEYQFKELFIPTAKYRKDTLYKERLDIIESYIKPGILLDVGAAAGHFMESAIERGWDSYGVELSPFSVNYAKNNLKIKNIYKSELIQRNFDNNYFDVVTMWDVLEHLNQPLNIVKEAYRILRSGGMLFVYVPNYDSVEVAICHEKCDTIVPDAHIIYFTPKTIRKLLEKSGFQVVFQETKGLDIDHIIFNIKNHYREKYDLKFITNYKDILQEVIDKSGKANWVRIYGIKK